ncbi:type I polyketide synthase [Mycobacterium sp.]|uniref:type I polyketide synthase n=1 Tax=Mycobacterium sp. TaxID=1785 RepID=UPI002DA326EA|nr:type I polyketide synthase [Mycobacterium sp.]
MTVSYDEVELRHWLVDYLVTNIGCSPDDVDFNASLNDLGFGSRDAIALSGELSELLGRQVSPVEFWQHPTINALAGFLTGSEPDSGEAVLASAHGSMDEPIAVIGLGCRFPADIRGPEVFWEFLRDGRSAVGEVPPDRWTPFDDGSPEAAAALSHTTRWGSFLTDIDAFDAEFFDVSPSEAAKMDPQQRLLLEVAHEALEHAGVPANSLRHSQTGVFAGACLGEYGYLASTDLSQVDAWSGTGGALSIIANRVSYFFDLRGPSVTVDTACSSSLVAVHLACQSLRTGDANLAIAAGVNLLLSPAVTRSFDQAEAMSPTGGCHAFDSSADGFVRGEGCGVAVLKRLTDALRDGDRVLAVVRGSAVNQDGRSNGLMAPNPAAQMAVLRTAYANAGVQPRDVDYVEAHGTGTLLGDPIEARALGTVLGRARRQNAPLLIGAVKSNLGHLEAAAGIAGFIKTVLSVQRGRIPATLHFQTPNPHIPLQSLQLKVVAEPTDWPVTDRPRRAGVSSFGFGGTNAHVVLEQAPNPVPVTAPPSRSGGAVTTLVVSGKTYERVASTAGMLADWMERSGAQVAMEDVAHTLNHHRSRHAKFATVAACNRAQAIAGLRALAAARSADGVVAPHQGVCRPGTVFVYSGQGSQWPGMGRQLLADEPAFAAAVAELEPAFVDQTGFSLRQVLAAGEPVVGIHRIQPVLVGMHLALTELWRSYGVEPDAVIGHSMGEVSAAVVAGALSAAEGLRVIATRSRLMSRLSGRGAMALLELDAEATAALIRSHPAVTLAVYASPRQSVIAGPPEDVETLMAAVAAQDRLVRRIEVDVASHNPIIDPVLPELRAQLADLTPGTPTIPFISTTHDHTTSDATTFDAEYWVANLRNPVRFNHAIAAAGADHATFVEVSPHPVLTHSISDTLADVHHHSVPTLQRDDHGTLTFHTNLNATHTIQPPKTDHVSEPHPVIPTTPWHHSRHWMTPRKRVAGAGSAPRAGTLLGEHITVATTPPGHLWQARLVPEAKPYPGCHRIHGLEVVPVSVLLQTMVTASADCGGSALSSVRFEHPIVLDQPRVIQVVADGESLTVASSPVAEPGAHRWVRHVSARLSPCPLDNDTSDADVWALNGREYGANGIKKSVAELLEAWGVEGQPFTWSIQSLQHTEAGAVADVRLAEASTVALLDAAVHVARLVDESNPRLMVPAAVDSVRLGSPLTDLHGSVEIRRRTNREGDDLIVDIAVKAPDGSVCVDIRSLRYADVESRPGQAVGATSMTIAHAIEWQPWHQASEEQALPEGRHTVVILGADGSDGLQARLADGGYVAADLGDARYVVYLAEPRFGEDDIDCAVRLSADVGELVRVLAQRDDSQPATMWIITRGVHDADTDAALPQSCLWGLAAVIAAEQPQLWGGLIDIPAGGDICAHAHVLSTLLPVPCKSILVSRDGELLAPAVVPISDRPVREPLRCRPDAAYLVTGGMGALGLLIADWLADRGARRIVLAGRTALPPRHAWDTDGNGAEVRQKVAAVRALEMRGVSVDVVALDVGSREAVQALLSRRNRDGAPPIRGVIHAAGVTESTLLTEMADNMLRRVMWPKIAGGQALHEAFPPGSLEFFFMTASAGTVFGVPGQGAYASANAYLDCLARSRHEQGCHSVSLDWVAWRGLGFASNAAIVMQELERLGSRPVSPEEAFAAWEYVDSCDIAQAVMVPMPSCNETATADRTLAPAWSQMAHDDLLRELEIGLRAILAGELRIPEAEVEVDRPFAELGLNSLMAMSIRREVEQLVGIELSATMLWNHPTIATLTAYLTKRLSPQKVSENDLDPPADSANSVLDTLFDSIESTPASVESGIR